MKFYLVILLLILCNVCAKNGRRTFKKKHIGVYTNDYKFNIFKNQNNTNETAQLGSTARLECFVKYNSAALNVTWWKVDTNTLLTTNNRTEVKDKRFLAETKPANTHNWLLRIRYSKMSDEGLYECRLEGDFKVSIFMRLHLLRARAVIKDSSSSGRRFVKVGVPLRLSCFLNNSIESPTYFFWYKEDRVINYDLEGGESIREGRQGSELIFPSAKLKHTGNYSCVPSNAEQANVEVLVQTEDKPTCQSHSDRCS